MTPNKERLLLFVEALESGDYEQCNSKLTVIGMDGKATHCCLGVATEVALVNGVEGVERVPTQDSMHAGGNGPVQTCDVVAYVHEYEDRLGGLRKETNFLPGPVASWYGLPSRNPALQDPAGLRNGQSATALNDDLRLDFTQIAAWFRHTYDLGPQ